MARIDEVSNGVYLKDNGKYEVVVWDHGSVIMCELVNGKWRDCEFDTQEEAEETRKRYLEVKRGY